MREIRLQPIREDQADFDALEEALKEFFRQEIYLPLLKEIGATKEVLQNSVDDVVSAILSGQLSFHRGVFSGRFNARLTRELRALGAKWDPKIGAFRISVNRLPLEINEAIEQSVGRFNRTLQALDRRLDKILPEEIAEKLQVQKFFDTTLWKTDRKLRSSLKGLAITPDLTREQRQKIAKEYTQNMKLWVQDFTEKEIVRMRKRVQRRAFEGQRYEGLVREIQSSYGVSLNKAKFLARQETAILMTKFKESRYKDAGVSEYIWRCVAGSKLHPVRPAHKVLDGKKYSFDNPPISTAPGEPVRRNNPGQDYNCRCIAIPVVKFK